MSDDTPTQRFDTAGDTPTERLSAPSEEVVEERKSRRLITILAIIGGLLLVAVLIVLILLLTRGSGTPTALPTSGGSPSASASSTPSATPTKTATPTPTPSATATQAAPPPPDDSTRFVDLSPQKQVSCYDSQAPNYDPTPIIIKVSWKSINATEVWFASNSDDAANDRFMQLPTSGDQSDFPYEIDFPCPQASISYTITLVGQNGEHVTKKWTVKNVGFVHN